MHQFSDPIGFCGGGYWVVGVASRVGSLGVPWSGLGCCGWLGAGPVWGWGLGVGWVAGWLQVASCLLYYI